MPYGVDPPMDAGAKLDVLKGLICRCRSIVIPINRVMLNIRALPQDILREIIGVSFWLLSPRGKS
jgi:hypothetical protein